MIGGGMVFYWTLKALLKTDRCATPVYFLFSLFLVFGNLEVKRPGLVSWVDHDKEEGEAEYAFLNT